MLILLATLGMLLMISANDLIALYLGLELQSLALYVVAAIHRDKLRSTEAGLKYFVLGALSSGMLLYGSRWSTASPATPASRRSRPRLASGERQLGLIFGLVFLLAGLAFKISAVPFHMWTPDVYEGAPTPVTAFFAAAPKMAAMALLVRVIMSAFEPIAADWQQIVVFISIASMVLGSFAAIGQTQHQAADGLFVDRPHGLRAGRPRRRQPGRRARRRHLHGDLHGHDARHLRRHPRDAARATAMSRRSSDLAGLSSTNPAMAFVLRC